MSADEAGGGGGPEDADKAAALAAWSEALASSSPSPRVIVGEARPGPGASRSHGETSEAEARRVGLTMSCALSFPARRAALTELQRGERLRGRALSDRERLGGPLPRGGDAAAPAAVNVWVEVGEERVMVVRQREIAVMGGKLGDARCEE
ncbi:hypothetical protein G6O69_15485 [Pseudenhygromyxa sp. WMMC2535]|uniref:hypothetical protein n=1 Tax=Pseudenhygromyxa sp. WMMC2535 TaxID=2712867 RepID=UPI001556B2B6|nr:hypothetical protein [Pseudenhygromyxa sp. WMMC2535]NVB39245.1 hypothetical protein [Pseudenhygromyxa sp. WMMC2535]